MYMIAKRRYADRGHHWQNLLGCQYLPLTVGSMINLRPSIKPVSKIVSVKKQSTREKQKWQVHLHTYTANISTTQSKVFTVFRITF